MCQNEIGFYIFRKKIQFEYLKHVIHGGENILDGLILGDVLQEAEEGLGTLGSLILQHCIPLVTGGIEELGDEAVVILANHLGSDEK